MVPTDFCHTYSLKKTMYTYMYVLLQKYTILDLITAHTPISAHSSTCNSVVFKYSQCTFSLHVLQYKGTYCGYPFELHRLVNAIPIK